MSGHVGGHVESGRRTTLDGDGTWHASITCSCGWTETVEGHLTHGAAVAALDRGWTAHQATRDRRMRA